MTSQAKHCISEKWSLLKSVMSIIGTGANKTALASSVYLLGVDKARNQILQNIISLNNIDIVTNLSLWRSEIDSQSNRGGKDRPLPNRFGPTVYDLYQDSVLIQVPINKANQFMPLFYAGFESVIVQYLDNFGADKQTNDFINITTKQIESLVEELTEAILKSFDNLDAVDAMARLFKVMDKMKDRK